MERVGAIVVAAGEGSRMGGVDKIFTSLAGKPLLAHSVDVLQRSEAIDCIVIVLSQERVDEGQKLVESYGWDKVSAICPGGARRQDSVSEGLKRLSDCGWVAIHDGARPCLTPELIEAGLSAARESGAAIPVIPVKDTIKAISEDSLVLETPQRQALRAVQTPQVFNFDIIAEAYSAIEGDVTDDASLVERLGYKVKAFPGSEDNIKVTTSTDLILAESILKEREK